MLYLLPILIILLDQLTKFTAIKYLKSKGPVVIIKNFFQLYYVENLGAAFGILQYKRIFFMLVTIIVVICIIIFLIKSYQNNSILSVGLLMLLGGAIGNLIDRIRLGYVIDFISFKFGQAYDFPIFNIADTFIVVGTFIIMIVVLLNKHEY